MLLVTVDPFSKDHIIIYSAKQRQPWLVRLASIFFLAHIIIFLISYNFRTNMSVLMPPTNNSILYSIHALQN